MKTTNATDACEAILAEQIRYNIEHEILPSEIAVARRLLARRAELALAYEELHAKLGSVPPALETFLGILLSTRAHWSPAKIAQARADRAELEQVNVALVDHAQALAGLLDRRDELHNTSGFSGSTLYHIQDVIEAANADNFLFRTYLQKPLAALSGQFDLKYWPSLGNCMRAIAHDASKAQLEATDPLTEAATASSRPSKSDFVLALYAHIEECRGQHLGCVPTTYHVSDSTMATLVNVLLDLAPGELVDAAYVKGRRHRAKELAAHANV